MPPNARSISAIPAVMCIDGRLIAKLLGAIRDDNVKREFYLTDAVRIARAAGHKAIAVAGEEAEFQGINSRVELAVAEQALQQRLRHAAMLGGVTMTDPGTVWLSADTKFGTDVTIGPNVRFGIGVTVGANTVIKAFCDIEGARIGKGAIIGPFARIRPGSDVADEAHIGNFVELKATRMGRGAKANHLAYLGDADIGPGSNIGAGTIAVNYDGYGKHRTVIGPDVFIGSNSSLVAPLRVGRGANVTAGSVVTEDVPADAVAFGRAGRSQRRGGRRRFVRNSATARQLPGRPPLSGPAINNPPPVRDRTHVRHHRHHRQSARHAPPDGRAEAARISRLRLRGRRHIGGTAISIGAGPRASWSTSRRG